MKCGACKRDCRSTSLAYVAEPDGGMRRARVCGTCFNGAIHIVPSVTTVKKGVSEVETTRRESKDIVKGAVHKLRGVVAAYSNAGKVPPEYADRVEGIEQAIDILKAGDF